VSRLVFRAAFVDRACEAAAWTHQRTQVPVEYPKMMNEAFDGLREQIKANNFTRI